MRGKSVQLLGNKYEEDNSGRQKSGLSGERERKRPSKTYRKGGGESRRNCFFWRLGALIKAGKESTTAAFFKIAK